MALSNSPSSGRKIGLIEDLKRQLRELTWSFISLSPSSARKECLTGDL